MLFSRTVEIYESRNKAEWKAVREALKTAGVRFEAGYAELQCPIGGCGAKIDIRRDNPDYDPLTSFIEVKPAHEQAAKAVLSVVLGRNIL